MLLAPLGLGGLLVQDRQDELVQPVLLAFRKLVLQAFRERVPLAPLGRHSLDRPAGLDRRAGVSQVPPDPVERHRQDPQDHH